MSTLSSWSYVEGPVTIWPIAGLDPRNQPTYGTPYIIPQIDYQIGGKVERDENGDEFIPNIIIYFEAADNSSLVPKRDWYMKIGDHTGESTPPKDAERIRTILKWPMTKFGAGQLPDYKVTA